mgnify:CR=1 FL=1
MGRRKRATKTGGILIWKPVGITSRSALDRAERALDAGPLGHTGTLDPLAEGLLLLLGGEARKFQALLTDHTKSYSALVTFGELSGSDDAEGPLYCRVPRVSLPTREAVEGALERFRGGYEQIPPGHSAIHIDGERAYKRVRRGEVVEMPARSVTIDRLELVSFEGATCQIEIDCGPGTYVRAIARDLGEAVGSGAYLSGLARTRLGGLVAESAIPLEEVTAERWQSLETLVNGLPRLEVDEPARDRLALGQRVPHPLPDGVLPGSALRVVWCEGAVVGLGEMRAGVIQPRRMFARS